MTMAAPSPRLTPPKPHDDLDDRQLIELWRSGQRCAGDTLIARHIGDVQRFFANKALDSNDVADLVSQTFLGCTSALERLHSPDRFRPFLFGIATNVLRNHFRRRAKRALEASDFSTLCVRDLCDRSFSSLVMEKRKWQAIVDALREVSVNDQIILEYRYLMGHSAQRISEILDEPASTVRGRLMRARNRLRGRVQVLLEERGEAANPAVSHAQIDQWSAQLRRGL